MIFRLLSAVLVVCLLSACPLERKDPKKKAKAKEPDATKDQSGDIAFQSFVGRLRIAVDKRDARMLTSLMSPDFGYRWDTPAAGQDPFTYWEQNGSWPELSKLMRARWVPYDGFMVVPAEFAADPTGYGGFRAGVRMINGSWRFAYFVPAPTVDSTPGEVPLSPAPTSL